MLDDVERVTLSTFNALAVVVMYKVAPTESIALQSLIAAARQHSQPAINGLNILVFDNTPGGCRPDALPKNIEYEAPGRNVGIAAAYNRALEVAEQKKCNWLLTLDQDTTLPENFITDLDTIALRMENDPSVAVIVPQLISGSSVLSPNYVGRFRNSPVPKGFNGINPAKIYALNSGSLFRVAALREIGGFCEDFWLDQLDFWIHNRFQRAGKRTYIAGNLEVEHRLSLQDYGSLSCERFQNFLLAESAFFDQYRGLLENFGLTATLFVRYCKHRARGTNPALLKEIASILKQRVFQSKRQRITQWRSHILNRSTKPAGQEIV